MKGYNDVKNHEVKHWQLHGNTFVCNNTVRTGSSCEGFSCFYEKMTKYKKTPQPEDISSFKSQQWQVRQELVDQNGSDSIHRKCKADSCRDQNLQNTWGSSEQRRPTGSLRERPFQFEPFAVTHWCWHPDRGSLPHTFLSH